MWIKGRTEYITQGYRASGNLDLSTCNRIPEPVVLATVLFPFKSYTNYSNKIKIHAEFLGIQIMPRNACIESKS